MASKHQEAGSVSWGTASSIAIIQTCIAQYLSLYNTLVSASQDGDNFRLFGMVHYCWICLASLGSLIIMIIQGLRAECRECSFFFFLALSGIRFCRFCC